MINLYILSPKKLLDLDLFSSEDKRFVIIAYWKLDETIFVLEEKH